MNFSEMDSWHKHLRGISNLEKELNNAKNFDIIVLDSYRRFLEGTENDSEITDKFFNEYIKKLKEQGKIPKK